jgi:putative ABC transport system permease protein
MSAIPGVITLPRPRAATAPRKPRRRVRLSQTTATAFEALSTSKLRSLLTALGIIIGVGAVVLMVALGNGATASVTQRLQGLGTNLLTVSPGSTAVGGVRAGAGTRSSLTAADAQAIQADVDGLTAVSPVLNINVQAIANDQNWSTQVQGVFPAYQAMENWQVQSGALFAEDDDQQARSVAVIGQTVLDNLFGNGNAGSGDAATALGQSIRLNRVPFQIAGVLASKSEQQDNVILVPYTTAHVRLNNQQSVNQIVVQVQDPAQMGTVQVQIQQLLEQRHRIANGQDDFNIRNFNSIVQTAEGVTQTLTLLLSAVAAISLVVGGIGIMNIMLVSVTERTREIGIRLAIGARPGDILSQFLIEAIVLSVAGGLIGITCGVVGSALVARVAGWNTVIAPASLLLAFGFAAAVGVFFGYYPARKASKLQPIEALHYE